MSIRISINKIPQEKKEKMADDLIIKPVNPSLSRSSSSRFNPPPPPPFPFYTINQNTKEISIPLHYAKNVLGLSFDKKKEQRWRKLSNTQDCNVKFRNQNQKAVYDKAVEHLENTGGAIIGIPPGEGKTILGVTIASDSGLLTLIVVPRTPLIGQWMTTYKKCYPDQNEEFYNQKVYMPGVTKEKGYDFNQVDFIITMDTRIKKIPKELLKQVGFLIIDEGHMLSTSSRVDAFLDIEPMYVLVETATLKRDDGQHVMMELMAGRDVISPDFYTSSSKKDIQNPSTIKYEKPPRPYKVIVINTNVYYEEEISSSTGRLDFTDLSKKVSECEILFSLIKEIIEFFILKTKRKVITLTNRAEQAFKISNSFSETEIKSDTMVRSKKGYKNCDLLVGTMPKIGTGFDESTFCEGFDGVQSSVLILTSSTKKWQSFEQMKGRVMRCDESIVPVVIMFTCRNTIFDGHLTKLKPWIKKTGGQIIPMNILNYKNNFEKIFFF